MFDYVTNLNDSNNSNQSSKNGIMTRGNPLQEDLNNDDDVERLIVIKSKHNTIPLSLSTPPFNNYNSSRNILQISSEIHPSTLGEGLNKPVLKSILKSNNNSNNSSLNNSAAIIFNSQTLGEENSGTQQDDMGILNNSISSNRNIFRSIKNIFKLHNLKTFLLVFLISNLGYSTFFSYTSAEALSYTFYQTFNISSSQFGWIFTAYALPNLVMVFASGVLVDKIGPDKVSIMLGTCVTLSTLIGALSPPNFTLMLVSRFLLGFAGESLVACSNTLMSKWFSSSSLPIYMGILVGWIYSANLTSLTLLPLLNKRFGFQTSLWIISFVAIFGYCLNIIYLLTRSFFKDVKEHSSNSNNSFKELKEDEIEVDIIKDDQETLESYSPNGADLMPNSSFFGLDNNDGENFKDGLIGSSVELEEIDIKQTPSLAQSRVIEMSNSHHGRTINELHEIIRNRVGNLVIGITSVFKDIPQRMWIVVLIVLFGYSTLFGLAIIGPDFLGTKYGYDEQMAALILSSETISSALFSPLCGFGLKYISKRIIVLWTSLALLGVGVLLLVITNIFPLPWILVSGIGYSILNTTIISSIPTLVPEKSIGASYGLVGTAYNTGLVLFPYFLGLLKEKSGDYTLSLLLLVLFSIIASLLVAYLKYLDTKEPIDKRLDK